MGRNSISFIIIPLFFTMGAMAEPAVSSHGDDSYQDVANKLHNLEKKTHAILPRYDPQEKYDIDYRIGHIGDPDFNRSMIINAAGDVDPKRFHNPKAFEEDQIKNWGEAEGTKIFAKWFFPACAHYKGKKEDWGFSTQTEDKCKSLKFGKRFQILHSDKEVAYLSTESCKASVDKACKEKHR